MKVFLSYPSEHEAVAREVAGFIRSVGLDCWFDKDSLIVGQDWDRERGIAQSNADLIVLLCATQTTTRDGVYQRELNQALTEQRDKRLGAIYLMPMIVENAPLPPELSRLQYAKFFEPDWRQKLAASFAKAMVDEAQDIPPMLQVAAAAPDEGGLLAHEFHEETEKGIIDATWLQYTVSGDFWDYVNSEISHRVLGGIYTARRHFAEWQNGNGSDWGINVTEFHRKGHLVSLVFGHFDYFAGAAHPNQGITTVNILGETGGLISAGDLFDYSPEALKFVTDYVNLDLKRQYSASQEDVDISSYAETYGWELYDQFTFNEAGMRINLSASSGLPHVLGHHEIYLPWEHVSQFLSPVSRTILLGHNAQ